MKQKWKQKLPGILLGLVFLVGLGIFAYPTVADQWNKYHQSRAIASYEETVADMDEVDYQKLWEMAEEYNSQIGNNTFDGDAFSQEEQNMRGSKYWSVLNPGDNGIMGYISIPKIEQRLPIYHGTSEAVLQIGAGHMSGTSLPVGGEGKHSVLAAHRGLPSAKLFTDIDQLVEGDKFYVHVLDKVLAYEVDQILPMVEKDDTDTLTEAMKNVEGEDYVTLFTCTPLPVALLPLQGIPMLLQSARTLLFFSSSSYIPASFSLSLHYYPVIVSTAIPHLHHNRNDWSLRSPDSIRGHMYYQTPLLRFHPH